MWSILCFLGLSRYKWGQRGQGDYPSQHIFLSTRLNVYGLFHRVNIIISVAREKLAPVSLVPEEREEIQGLEWDISYIIVSLRIWSDMNLPLDDGNLYLFFFVCVCVRVRAPATVCHILGRGGSCWLGWRQRSSGKTAFLLFITHKQDVAKHSLSTKAFNIFKDFLLFLL